MNCKDLIKIKNLKVGRWAVPLKGSRIVDAHRSKSTAVWKSTCSSSLAICLGKLSFTHRGRVTHICVSKLVHNWFNRCLLTWFTNPTTHLSNIPQCTIQYRIVHISVLNGVYWDMRQVHCGICECGVLEAMFHTPVTVLMPPGLDCVADQLTT